MGVPKFYRWVSERYPCLSQVVQEHQIPEFDNLYLDMNGIIHPCSHPNDDDPHFRITEEQIFRNIFHYIEVLFQIIKPKKVFFMAVDGVAPRAKMNQQRGRRFRSAKEAEDNIRRALDKGQVLPKEERFDSNCITPGTVFMTRLQEQLKYFVAEKISNDPAWQGLKVYLSGHQTPGEGEHKIMEFIRTERSKQGYDPNTRHCLYGLDADLMMLGLSTHEPHFSLLREEVRFGRGSKKIEKPESITFHLLHLSLFREYLDWEFHALKNSLSFAYDLERIIDDWILMGFLVGNDFIPHLPHLHINHNALPMLYNVYIEVMPTLDGYLHEGGILCLDRFEKYLTALSKLDREKFDEIFVDMKWFEAKTKHGFDKKPGGKQPKAGKDKGFSGDNFAGLDSFSDQLSQINLDPEEDKMSPELAKLAAAMGDEEDNEDEDVFEIEFAMHKKQYYRDKFEIEDINSGGLSRIVWEYVRGIQWILHYYFNGVQSWGWYYPYNYAPFLSDLKFFSEQELEYDMGMPFLPFEQLLAVLPAASKQLLPLPLQNLMIMEESPIIDFYPLNFKTDLNGKQQEWEAVVLIPFIDEEMLLDAIKPLYSRLTKEERQRNTHGAFLVYTYDSQLSCTYPSSLPGIFPDILLCHAKCEEFDREVLVTPPQHLIKGLCKDVHLDVYFPGFPTLHHIQHTAELKKANVKVFQMHSRWESMILKLEPHPDKVTIRVAEDLLGEVCYVGWPHMVEAKVTSVSDNTFKYVLSRDKPKTEEGNKNIEQNVMTNEGLAIWNKQVSCYVQYQMERRGIEIGEVSILVEACPIQGRRYVCSTKGQVTLEKEWSQVPKQYALQAIAKDIFVHESVTKSSIQTIEELFPVGSQCFMLASPHYGAQGEVLEVDVNQGRVRVQLKVPTEPNITPVILQKEALSVKYMPAHVLAQKLGISNSLLGKITSKFLVERGSREKSKGQGQTKLDIGLNLKHTKHNKELLGYTRRTEQGSWSYSDEAHKVIADYTQRFPRLFEAIGSLESTIDQFYESDLLSQNVDESTLQEVHEWLKTLPIAKQQPLPCGGDVLDEPALDEIQKIVHETKQSSSIKAVKVRVRPYLLFKPSDYLGNILPDSDAEFQLFDRVINVKLNSAVPYGLRGTIVGFHTGEDGDEMVEVLYDDSFVGHQPVRPNTNSIYMVRPSSFIDLSYGERREAKKRGQPVPPPRPLNKSFSAALAGGMSPKRNGSPIRNNRTNGGSPRTNRQTPQGTHEQKESSLASPLVNGKNPNQTSSLETGSPVVTVTRIAMPPNRPVTSQVGSMDKIRGWNTEREIPPRFLKTKKDKTQTPQAVSNNTNEIPPRFLKTKKDKTQTPQAVSNNTSEFANMWKELQMKENSPPHANETSTQPQGDQQTASAIHTVSSIESESGTTPNDVKKILTHSADDNTSKDDTTYKSPDTFAKESTQALCQLLNIGHHSPPSSGPNSPRESKIEDAKTRSQTPGTPLTVEELFKSQGTASSPQPPPQPPPKPTPGPSLDPSHLPSFQLLMHCSSTGLPPPVYHYNKGPMGIVAVVELANFFKIPGSWCKDRAEAVQSASAVALLQLNRLTPAFQQQHFPVSYTMTFPGQPMPQNPMRYPPQMQARRAIHQQHPQYYNQDFRGGYSQVRPAGQRMAYARHGMISEIPGMAHAGHGIIPTGTRMTSTPNNASHETARMAFVPLQVTRRNAPSKAEIPTQAPSVEARQDNQVPEVKASCVSSNQGSTEPALNNVPSQLSSQTVLVPPSSFSDSVGAQGPIEDQTGTLSMNLSKTHDTKDQQIKQHDNATKGIKEDSSQKTRSSSTRKGPKRLMAPNFFQN